MITLNNLVIGYDRPIQGPLNHVLKDGKIYGILGKSGCGKSTLLRTIAGLHKPLSGAVQKRPEDDRVIYMMHQRYANFNWLTVEQNVLIAQRDKRLRHKQAGIAQTILRRVGLGDYMGRYPTELSGGMQQRLALARVLFAKPYYLLMDEPLSALDDATRSEMQRLIVESHRETGGMILMVTHSEAEAEIVCDEIIKL